MASRRAYADEYAVRVNRAVELLVDRSSADTVRALQADFGLSERQARRYVNAGLERPEGMAVPERTAVFTVRLAPSLIGGLRAHAHATGQTLSAATAAAVCAYLDAVGERSGGQAR
jgi:predicted DNA-binding transcriptional regulator YafY